MTRANPFAAKAAPSSGHSPLRTKGRGVHGLPMARLFGAFIILGLAVQGIFVGLLVVHGLSSAYENEISRLLESRTQALAAMLERSVDNHVAVLEDVAANPMLASIIERLDDQTRHSTTFLDRLILFGTRPRLLLFDADAGLIHDTAGLSGCLPRPEALTALSGAASKNVEFLRPCGERPDSGSFLRLAVPVPGEAPHAPPKGFLAADIPLRDLDVVTRVAESDSNETLTLFKDREVLYSTAENVEGAGTERHLPDLGVTLAVHLDLSGVSMEREAVLLRTVAVVAGMVLLFGLTGIYVGRRLFVTPLLNLQRRAAELRAGEIPPATPLTSDPWVILEIQRFDRELQDAMQALMTKQAQLEQRSAQLQEANQALGESQRLLAATGRTARVGGWQLDTASQRLTWTDETYRIHELGAEFTPTVKGALSFYPDESRPVIQEAVERLVSKGEPFDLELPLVTARGRRIWVRSIGEPMWDAGFGPPQGGSRMVGGTFQDITQRKQAEDALRESEERFRRLAENARDVIFRLSLPDRRYEYISPATRDIIGLDPEKFYANPDTIADMIHPDYMDFFRDQWQRLVKGDVDPIVEYKVVDIEGREHWLHQRNVLIRDAAGAPVALEGIVTDLTERKAAEEARRRSERFSNRIIESSPDCIKILDRNLNLEFMSQGGARLLKLGNPETLIGQPYIDFWSEEERGKVLTALRHASDKRETADFEAFLPDFAGDPRWWSVSVTPLENDSGEVERYLVVSRDVTMLKQAEQKQREAKEDAIAANRAKSEFLANMSHEIRTPMNGILGMAQLLLGSCTDDEHKDALETIRTSAQGLMQLINDILDLSRIESGRLELEQETFRLENVLQSTVDILVTTARAKGLSLSWRLQPGMPTTVFHGDVKRLRQVLLNLAGNALKFTERGFVEISAGCEGGCILPPRDGAMGSQMLRFHVRDSGVGIAPKDQERIFESFVQGDGSKTRYHGGAGLGLTLANRLVRVMGGELGVQSELGQGSDFSFTAPFQTSKILPVPAIQKQAADEPPQKALDVLVVDDNELNRLVAKRMIERSGHKAQTTASGKDALQLMAENSFDMVFIDVEMPGMDGLETTRRIREGDGLVTNADTFVTAMTAHAMPGDRERFLAAGMNDYLPKPLSLENIGNAIRRYMLGAGAGSAGGGNQERTATLDDLRRLSRIEALHRFAEDEELYSEACSDYLGRTPATLEKLEAEFQAGNLEAALLHAHSIKGNSATLGAERAAELAHGLEHALQQKDSQAARELLNRLGEELAELLPLLEEHSAQ